MRTDKRKSLRRPVDCTAWIARPGKPLEACALADVSDKGARLAVLDIDSIPDEFMLFLSPRGTPRRRCRVAWRANGQVGVRFEAPPRQRKSDKTRAMIAAHQASLQPDMDASDDAPIRQDETAEPDKTEPA